MLRNIPPLVAHLLADFRQTLLIRHAALLEFRVTLLRPGPAQTVTSLVTLAGFRRSFLQSSTVGVLVELEPCTVGDRRLQAGVRRRRNPDFPLLAALSLDIEPTLYLSGTWILAQPPELVLRDVVGLGDPAAALPLDRSNQVMLSVVDSSNQSVRSSVCA